MRAGGQRVPCTQPSDWTRPIRCRCCWTLELTSTSETVTTSDRCSWRPLEDKHKSCSSHLKVAQHLCAILSALKPGCHVSPLTLFLFPLPTSLCFRCSFSQESLPAVSHPDQEIDWPIQAETAPRPSSPVTAHRLSGAHLEKHFGSEFLHSTF